MPKKCILLQNQAVLRQKIAENDQKTAFFTAKNTLKTGNFDHFSSKSVKNVVI